MNDNERKLNAAMVGVGPNKTWEDAHDEAVHMLYLQAQELEDAEADNERLRAVIRDAHAAIVAGQWTAARDALAAEVKRGD